MTCDDHGVTRWLLLDYGGVLCTPQPEEDRRALERAGVGYTEAGLAGLDVEVLGGEASAARLLAELVGADVQVTAFSPLGGALEQTYLNLVEGQR